MAIVKDRRKLRREATVEEILQASVELMARDGVAGMSLSAVARAVGMKPPSLYEYFPSKNALYDALFERGAAAQLDFVLAAGTNPDLGGDPVSALRAGALAYVEWSVANPVAAQLLNWRPVPDFEPTAHAMAPSVAMVESLRAHIALAVERKQLDAAAATDDAALLFTSVITGVVSQQLANEPAAGTESGRYTRLTDQAVSMWLGHFAVSED